MPNLTPIAVTSRSFSRHPTLRAELKSRYPNTKFNDTGVSLRGAALIDFLQGAEKAITALETIDGPLLDQVDQLRLISKYGVGLDMIDRQALAARGLELAWTAGVNRRSVAELTLAFMLMTVRKLPTALSAVQDGDWHQVVGKDLSGKRIGIIGFGYIGQDLARLLQPFDCTILAHDVVYNDTVLRELKAETSELGHLLNTSDIVSLHLPLDSSTENFLSCERLSRMRKGAVLINAARGGLVDEAAVKQRLFSGALSAVALDVFATEPPDDIELLNHPNFIATPHIGGSSEEAILAMGRAAIEGLEQGRNPLEVMF